MSAPGLALLVAASLTGAATPAAAPPSSPAATTTSATPAASASAPATGAGAAGPDRGQVGVSLLAAGAGLATGSVVGLTLIEALTTRDRESQAVSPAQETLVSIGGAASAAIAGLSAVAIVVGGGLAISAALERPAGASPTE